MVKAVLRSFFLLLIPSFSWAGPAIRWESGTTAVEVSPSTVSASQCLRTDSSGSHFFAGPGCGASEAVFNEASGDVDLRVEGNGDANLLFGDAGNDRIGIKTNVPASVLDINGDASVRGQTTVTSTLTVQGNAFSVGTSTLVVTNGLVGVGTQNPAGKLHLSSGTLLIDGYPAAVSVGLSSFVVTQGNVGVGTANPATKFHLSSGTLTIDGDAQTGLISSRPVVLGVRSGPSAVLLVQSTGTAATDRIFEVRNDGGTPQWAIMNSGDFAFMANPGVVRSNTANGSDNQNLSLTAGGAEGDSGRGAFMEFYGNEFSVTPGDSIWSAGNVAGGNLDIRTGGAVRIFVAEGGNIGIPSVAPATLIHASSGTLLIDGNTAGLKISTANHSNATTITSWLSATATIDYGALSASTCTFATMTLNGAVDGDDIALGVPNALSSIGGLSVTGFVSSNNTVTISACCVTTGACSTDAPAVTIRATVWKH